MDILDNYSLEGVQSFFELNPPTPNGLGGMLSRTMRRLVVRSYEYGHLECYLLELFKRRAISAEKYIRENNPLLPQEDIERLIIKYVSDCEPLHNIENEFAYIDKKENEAFSKYLNAVHTQGDPS